MITDADVKKLKQTFVTKDDLKTLGESIAQEFQLVINMLGDRVTTSDRQEQEIQGLSATQDDHERRLDKVEDKIFASD